MARELHPLVGRETGVNVAPQGVGPALELHQLVVGFEPLLGGVGAQLLDLELQFHHRLLEIEPHAHDAPLPQRARSHGKLPRSASTTDSPSATRKRRERIASREWSGRTMCR